MSVTRMSRGILAVRRILSYNPRRPCVYITMRPPSGQVRHIYRGSFGRDSPFTQMEEFMKDMEKKFKRDVDGIFRDLPRIVESGMSRRPEGRHGPRFGEMEVTPRPMFGEVEDVSTTDTYKLSFNFLNAKPEDVKVSLKGRTLTVSGSAEEVTETSKSSRQISIEYEIPEDIDIDALESCMSHDSILTIEAPKTPPEVPEAPRPINIQRE